MPIILAFAGLALDTARLFELEAQLQNIADAASLAGAGGLEEGAEADARLLAVEYAALHNVLGEPMVLDGVTDVAVGEWDPDTRQLIVPGSTVNAVQVAVNLTENSSPPAPHLMFGAFLGLLGTDIGAIATAVTSVGGGIKLGMVLDSSGSMSRDNAFAQAKEAAKAVVDGFIGSGSEVGVIFYDAIQGATLNQNLSKEQDFDNVKQAIDARQISSTNGNQTPGGHTNIADGLRVTHELLDTNGNPITDVLLLSDGKANVPLSPKWEPYACGPSIFTGQNEQPSHDAWCEAAFLASRGIRVHTVALGDGADTQLMQSIAEVTGGEYRRSPTPEELESVFQEIISSIGVGLALVQ